MEQSELFAQYLRDKGKEEELVLRARDLTSLFLGVARSATDYLQTLRDFCDTHLAGKPDAGDNIIFLFWYHSFTENKPACTYLITLLGTYGVIASQERRMRALFGDKAANKVFRGMEIPPLGSDLQKYPAAISAYLNAMRAALSESQCREVLAGNHHGVNPDGFREAKQSYLNKRDLPTVLQQKHRHLVATLEEHATSGKLWFEQFITPEVVEYVRAHQEVQTGVIDGNRVIVRKIPYDPDAWLSESDPRMKRYHACHCPFVRAAILSGADVPDLWCYCSGGFTKLFFDYLFDKDLKVELLESVLSGGDSCTFAIYLE